MKTLVAILIFMSMFNINVTFENGKRQEYHMVFSILAFILFLIFF